MKVKVLLFVAILNAQMLFAQESVLIPPKPKDADRREVPLPYLREANMMWSKRVWRVIDLEEKMNLPLKFPVFKSSQERKNLMEVIYDALREGAITAYGYEDDEFTKVITLKEVESRGGARIDSVQIPSPDPPYDMIDTAIISGFDPDKVVAYRVKEDWYFDEQRSVMEVRIIGIAPLVLMTDEKGNVREGNIRIPLFWIYYPDARKVLAQHEVFNRGNGAARMTYADFFQKRFFGSYIVKEDNVYDRRIIDYTQGMNALLESERIKEEITNFEHDMWEF